MFRLTLEHIAPYLPYGVSIEVTKFNKKYITDSWGLKCQSDYLVSEYERGVRSGLMLSQIKPLLRPLSDLTREITDKWNKFIPTTELEKIRKGINIYKPSNYPIEISIQTEDYTQEIDLYDGYIILQKLFEWHFDVFGLIEKGLAIDINTLNNKI